MAVTIGFRLDRVTRSAAFLLGASLWASAGCGLLPTRDDISTAGSYVKDHVTGKARTDRINKNFAEARILERRQDYVGAERLYREVLEEEPRNRNSYHRLAVMAAQQGKYEDAHALYGMALQCDNPTADLWSDLGWCHYMQQQLPEAEGALRNALQLQPQHRGALNNLAMVVGEKGNLDESYQLFRKGGLEAEAECNFGFLCAHMGDMPRAQQHFSRALSLDPNLRPAADALLQVTGQLQQQMAVQHAGGAEQPVEPGAVALAGGQPAAAGPGVQNASHEQPAGASPMRPLIEVFRGGRRLAPSSLPAAPAPTDAANPAAPTARTPGLPPTQPFQLHATPGGQPRDAMPAYQPAPIGGYRPGGAQAPVAPSANVTPQTVMPQTAPAPYSMPNQPLPQYLQPSNTPVGR